MRGFATVVVPFGLIAIISGCGKPASETPANRPPAVVVEEPAPVESAEPDAAPPAAGPDERGGSDGTLAGPQEAPSPQMADPPEVEEAPAEESETSSSRKGISAVQRALIRAATGPPEQEVPPRTTAPKFGQ